MMKKALALALAVFAGLASAQKVKSQKELDAIKAVQAATDPAGQMKAIENVLENFADTEFKPALLTMQVNAAVAMGDPAKVIVYGENALKTNPKDYQTQMSMAQAIVQSTKEFDLDKADKLKRAEKLAADGVANINAATKPNPAITDEQWMGFKKSFDAQGHELTGMIATLNKKWDDAVKEYEAALALDPQVTTQVRLAGAYNSAGKPAEAAKMADQVLATPNLNATVKQIAQGEKDKATKAMAK